MKSSILYTVVILMLLSCANDSDEALVTDELSIDVESDGISEEIAAIEDVVIVSDENETDCTVDMEVYLADDSGTATNIRISPGGEVDITLPPMMGYLLRLTDSEGDWFMVQYIWSDMDVVFNLTYDFGWIHNSVLGASTRNYGGETINLYSNTLEKSEIVDSFNTEVSVKILEICNDWVKVSYSRDDKDYVGWLKKDNLCGSPVTTCS